MLKDTKNRWLSRFLLALAAAVIIIFIILNLPVLTQTFVGNSIIENHIEEVYTSDILEGNIDDSFRWLNGTRIPYGEQMIFPLFYPGIGVYRISGNLTVFIRPSSPSWFILTKTGNCGEHAGYMFETFRRLNYDVRTVAALGGDHRIIQVVNNETVYFIDPSTQEILDHSTYFENGQWGRIMALTTNGRKLDLTEDFIKNTTTVSFKQNVTNSRIKTVLKSTYLMNSCGRCQTYDEPRYVYQFKSENDSIVVSSGKNYVIEHYRNFLGFKFSLQEEIDLSQDTTVYSQDVPIKLKNLRLG